MDTVQALNATTITMTTTTTNRPPRSRRVLDDEYDDDDRVGDGSSSDVEHARPPPTKLRPSMRGIRQSLAATQLHRRRRRSSARFLRLHHPQGDEEDMNNNSNNSSNNSHNNNDTNLQELYQKAIRLNAENKINASNSWSLKLIENIDNFLMDDEEAAGDSNTKSSSRQVDDDDDDEKDPSQQVGNRSSSSRVNFTKASCTLDASVKIYSYRVDDVHLTSYKVLANLNRSDTNQQQQNKRTTAQGDEPNNVEEGGSSSSSKSRSRAPTGSTIESHLANINLNKLDSAFDIDPLFSKMSKTFDEGGAKGLLLVNLGVGAQGCNIVFDSSCNDDADVEQEQPLEDETPCRRREGMIDISNLTSKLDSLLQQQQQSQSETTGSLFLDRETVLASLPLVPQLSQLRSQFVELEAQGFVSDGPETPSLRRHHRQHKRKSQFYGVSEQEEKEADRSIHQEAMERSRGASIMGRSFVVSEASRVHDEDEYGADDFGGGYDDDGDDDDADDIGFDQFIASEEARLSGISFDGSVTDHRKDKTTTALLDALADSPTLWATGDQYAYWNTDATHLLRQGNHWAGVAHWNNKKKQRHAPASMKLSTAATKASKKTPAKKSKRPPVLVDFSVDNPSNKLDAILFSSKKSAKGQKLQWSQTTITKHGRNENVLPLDAGIGVEQLASLFLRPDTVLKRRETSSDSSNGSTGVTKKQVGFAAGPWDDVSFGGGGGGGAFDDGMNDDDDDNGPGFVLASQVDEDFDVAELEGVRKVEKVQVGYATVAKKVDVKRLKKDLWNELEEVLLQKKKLVDISNMDDGESKEQQEEEEEDDPLEEEEEAMNSSNKCISFQQTVRDMEASKTQADVTLPFYFICILHLANEKGLQLDSKGLDDFDISRGPSF